MSPLAIQAQTVRTYADAARLAFGSMLDGNDATAQLARLLLALADSAAACAEETVEAQRVMTELARELGVRPPPRMKLRLINGGRS